MGRDSGDLTEAGRQYSILLTRFIKAQQECVMVDGTGHEVLILAGTQQVGTARIQRTNERREAKGGRNQAPPLLLLLLCPPSPPPVTW